MNSTKWEYKVVHVDAARWNKTGLPPQINEVLDEVLNELGEDLWELVRAEPILKAGVFFIFFGSTSYTSGVALFFKRPKK